MRIQMEDAKMLETINRRTYPDRLFSSHGDISDIVQMFMPSAQAGCKLDLIDSGTEYVLKADMPGVDKSNIVIDVKGQVVSISVAASAEDEYRYLIRERAPVSFSRQVRLPSEVDISEVKAGYENGVLTLKMPVRESAKPRTITVD